MNTQSKASYWEKLTDSKALAILTGGTEINPYGVDVDYPDKKISITCEMPLLDTPDLDNIANILGEKPESEDEFNQEALKNIILHNSNNNNDMRKILKYIFGKENFKKISKQLPDLRGFETVRKGIVNKCMDYINNHILFYSNCRLEMEKDGPDLILVPENWENEFLLEAPNIEDYDEYLIADSYQKIKDNAQKNDFEGVITQSRTLLEGILKASIKVKGKKPDDKANLSKLASDFKELYLVPIKNSYLETDLKKLFGSLIGMINTIGEIRNKFGDAHANGMSTDLNNMDTYFIANASITLTNFILNLSKNENN